MRRTNQAVVRTAKSAFKETRVFKKFTGLTCAAVLALLAGTMAGTAVAAELKIAVLDTQRALLESEEAQALLKQAQAELQSEESAGSHAW